MPVSASRALVGPDLGPTPVVEEWDHLRIVRDDLIPGGTKARVAHLLFDHYSEYVYAGPCQGYAQVAVAHACRKRGRLATLFLAKRRELHPRTVEAVEAGAVVAEVPFGYLNVVKSRATAYCVASGAKLLPFGLYDPRITDGIAAVARMVHPVPQEVWTVAGSGTLSLALQRAWPNAAFHAVLIGQRHETIGRARIWTAPEKYEQDAKDPPPFPSCSNYDAKLWQFVKRLASPGALVWNVAK